MTPAAASMRASRTWSSLLRVALASIVLVGAMVIVGPASNPEPVRAGTADYMEDLLLKWVNDARRARGLQPLKVGWRLEKYAGDLAASMASSGALKHTSCLSCTLRKRSVSFSSCAEVIARTSYPWGYDAARHIFQMWKSSSSHWSILMGRYTRVGFGVAYRSRDRTTWAAGILVR